LSISAKFRKSMAFEICHSFNQPFFFLEVIHHFTTLSVPKRFFNKIPRHPCCNKLSRQILVFVAVVSGTNIDAKSQYHFLKNFKTRIFYFEKFSRSGFDKNDYVFFSRDVHILSILTKDLVYRSLQKKFKSWLIDSFYDHSFGDINFRLENLLGQKSGR